MKRTGNIYKDICDLSNIKTAISKASLGKRKHKHVKKILDNIDAYALKIQEMLINKTYEPSPYSISTILDGANKKEREICKPRFYPDQIIHWALMLQIQPVISKGMYQYTCGSVPKRGTSFGQKALRKWLDTDFKNTKYCLKMDISKFYPSVDNNTLKAMFQKRIKDKECLWLIDIIIDTSAGLPIGNYTSQWFANFYLQDLDHLIKEKLNVKYYIRYVDDLVILGSNKRKLHKVKDGIEAYLTCINLKLKRNWQLSPTSKRPIDFLGFKFYKDKTILRKRIALRIKRRAKRISGHHALHYKDACAVVSYWGWIKRSDSYNFYNKNFKPYVNLNQAKKVVSNHGKRIHLCTDPRI